MEANTSKLPNSYPAHLFATRKLFFTMHAENEHWGRFFYVNRGALVIALILKVGLRIF